MTHTWFPSDGVYRRLLNAALAALLAFTVLVIVPGAPAHAQTAPNNGSCDADILFILDSSGSMEANSNEGLNAVRDGVSDFVDQLAKTVPNGGAPESDIAALHFSDAAAVGITPYKNVVTDGAAIKTYVTTGSYRTYAHDWTNWQAAFELANSGFTTPDFVFVLTDGQPTIDNSATPPANNATRWESATVAAEPAATALRAAVADSDTVVGIGLGSGFAGTAGALDRLKRVTDEATAIPFDQLAEELALRINSICDPELDVTKTVTPDELDEPGGTVAYTVAVENTSDITKADIQLTTFSDDKFAFPGNATCKLNGAGSAVNAFTTWIPYGDSLVCTWDETFSNKLPGWTHTNEVTAQAKDPLNRVSNTDKDTATVTILDVPSSIDLVKEADGWPGTGKAGDVVDYNFTITNDGEDTLTNVTLDDPKLGDEAIDWTTSSDGGTPAGTLSPGETVNGTGSYTLKQVDVDTGSFDNTATATGTPPTGEDVTDDGDETITVEADPEIEIIKSVSGIPGDEAGDTVKYSFKITNKGNVTLTDVTLDDPKLTDEAINWATSTDPTTPTGTLSPNESVTGTGSYVLTQGDVNAGEVENTATATGTPPGCDSDDCDVTDKDTETVPIDPNAVITLDKAADGWTEDAEAGDVVDYTFEIENAGNVTLTNVTLDDPLLTDETIDWTTSSDGGTPAGTLSPGETVNGTGSYTLTQADVDKGSVFNEAEACGLDPARAEECDKDDETIDITPDASITLDKAADSWAGDGEAGDVVDYVFEIENTGNVTLINVTLDDPKLTDEKIDWTTSSDAGTPDGTLSPGETVHGTGSYTLTQADVDNGSVFNEAEACGLDPDEAEECDKDDDLIDVDPESDIDLEKTGALGLGDDGIANPGDVITYEFLVTNTGATTLFDVDVTDPLPGLSALTCGAPFSEDASTAVLFAQALLDMLLSGDSVECTATYEITQLDIDAGHVDNCALATGFTKGDFQEIALEGADIEPDVSDEDCFVTPVPQTPSIGIEKSTNGEDADTGTGPAITVGDPVEWEFVVTNDGNVSLNNLIVVDDKIGDVCVIGDLVPGESDSCSMFGIAEVGQYANMGTVSAVHIKSDFSQDAVSDQIVLSAQDPSHYFGQPIAASATIGDTVWNDENQNAVQDNGEKGIAGAKVKLTNPDSTTVEAVTNASGKYLFSGLDAGKYTVAVVLSSIPTPVEGENKLTTAGSFTVDLAADQNFLTADFGIASALPKTGLSADNLALIALVLLLAGGLALLATRRKNDNGETDIAA